MLFPATYNIDQLLADPKNPYNREKVAYRFEDGTVIKFSFYNPNRGQSHSVGQVVLFMAPDVLYHSSTFDEVYKPLTAVDLSGGLADSGQLELFKDLDLQSKYFRGIIHEVIELNGDITPDTPAEVIQYTLAGEMLNANIFVWLLKNMFELNRQVENLLSAHPKLQNQ